MLDRRRAANAWKEYLGIKVWRNEEIEELERYYGKEVSYYEKCRVNEVRRDIESELEAK